MKKLMFLAVSAALIAGLTGCGGAPAQTGAEPAPEEPVPQAEPAAEPAPEDAPAETPEDAAGPESAAELDFTGLELTVTEGTLYIRAGDAFSLTRDGGGVDYTVDGGTLSCSISHTGETVLTLPTGVTYDALRLTVGAGHVYGEGALTFRSLDLEVGRGEATLEDFSAEEDSAIAVRQGAAFLSGDLGPSITADCREGHLSLELPCGQDDWDCEIELSGGGSIRFGRDSYRGRSASKRVDNGGARSIAVSCSRGDVSVEFDG